MDLAERLRRLGYAAPPRPTAPPPSPPGGAVDEVFEGEWRQTTHGQCFVARSDYDVAHEHGGVQLGHVKELGGRALDLLGRPHSRDGFDWATTAFLDTETTGLAGGTGTYVFLVGLGFFQEGKFVVEQFFMREYGEERALLAALAERLAGFTALVTFNGRVFDWPLLQTRYAMVGQRPPLVEPLHLDVLFPARRLWRERLISCGLSSLETNVLGLQRSLDVPGWLIPSIYFDYLRERDARPLRAVFAHNEQDLLSLLALTTRLGRHLDDPLREAGHPLDLFSLGRLFEGAREWEACLVCYEEALAQGLPPGKRAEAMGRLGLVYKRLARLENAERIWRSLVSRPDWPGLLPYLELAKYLEHREKKYSEAVALVERALSLAERRLTDPWQRSVAERQIVELEHRLRRLRRKVDAAPARVESGAWREEEGETDCCGQ